MEQVKVCLRCKHEYTQLEGTNCRKCASHEFKYKEVAVKGKALVPASVTELPVDMVPAMLAKAGLREPVFKEKKGKK